MKKPLMCLIVIASLTGCNSVAELSDQAPTLSYRVNRNYQAAYASLISGARRCYGIGPGMGGSQNLLNTDLYPDLGYGEISYTVAGVFSSYTPAVTRIEKDGNGALITIKDAAGHTAGTDTLAAWQKYWIGGGKVCPLLGAGQPPAS